MLLIRSARAAKAVSLSSLFLLVLFQVSCGRSYDTQQVKDYRLTVINDNAEVRQNFMTLIDDFNRFAGMTVLKYEKNTDQANSTIILTKGLTQRDGKVGWGQWIAQTQEDQPFLVRPGNHLKRVIKYSMRLEFDEEYILSRINEIDQSKRTDKQKLFFHEVGHGLQMEHDPRSSDIMYHDISGEKDFASFFRRVREYFADQ